MSLKKQYPLLFKKVCFMNLIKEFFIDNRGGNIKKYKKADVLKESYKLPCEKVYKILNIKPSGKVVSCSADFYEVNILGNVFYQSVKEIWLGKDFKKFRKSLDSGDRNFSKLCKKCNYLGSGGYFIK